MVQSHLDLGSFVLDAEGLRWADDLGGGSQRLPEKTAAARIAVLFTPGEADAEVPPVTALDEWEWTSSLAER